MTDTMHDPIRGSERLLSHRDGMSLSSEWAEQTAASLPDTLEVRGDSMVIVEDAVGRLRRPALISAAVVGAALVLVAVVGIVLKRGKHESAA